MTKKKITSATQEQWDEIERVRQRWVDEQTREVSFSEIVPAVHAVYKLLGDDKPMPLVFLVDGPIEVARATVLLGMLDKGQADKLDKGLAKLGTPEYSKILAPSACQDAQVQKLLDLIHASRGMVGLSQELADELVQQVLRQSNCMVIPAKPKGGKAKAEPAKLPEILAEQMRKLWVSLGWQVTAAFYEGAKILGVELDQKKYDTLMNWAKAVPLCYATEEVCIVSRWPTEVHWQNRVLHNEGGPAVQFRDGFSIWAIEGVQVDEQIVMRPETQTIKQIEDAQNTEVRRIRLDRYGWPKYLRDSKSECRDTRRNDIEGTLEALYRTKSGDKRLVVTCPTGRVFALGVPKDVKTCEQAQEWLNGGKKFNVIGAT